MQIGYGGTGGYSLTGNPPQQQQPRKTMTPTRMGVQPLTGGGTPATATPQMGAGPVVPGQTTFSATNNLIGSQFNPTNSQSTNQAQNWTQTSGQQFNNFQFQPFQQLQPMDFSAERGMLQGANQQMQGLSYNFNPANAQYTGAQGQLANAGRTATGMLQGLGGQSFGGGAAQANTSRFNSELDAALQGLQGPDRAQLAAESLALMEERSNPGFEQALRGVNQKAAAMGRRGSGITTNELGDVTLARERELALARRDLANNAAGQTLNDRLSVADFQRGIAGDRFGGEQFNAQLADAGAARDQQGAMFGANLQRGIAGDLYGMGRDQADFAMGIGDRYSGQERDRVGLGMNQADFQRGIGNDLGNFTRDSWLSQQSERDAGRSDEYGQFDAASRRFGQNADYLGRERDNDFNNRQEMRGERSWQYGLSRDAMDDEYRRMGFEEDLRDRRFNRGMGTAGLGFGAPSPVPLYQNQANQHQANAGGAWDAFGMLMQGLGNRRSGAGAGRTPNYPTANGTTYSAPTWG